MRRIVVFLPEEDAPKFLWVPVGPRKGYEEVDRSSFATFPRYMARTIIDQNS